MRDALREQLRKPAAVMLTDQLTFSMGVVNVMATEFFLLRSPEALRIWLLVWLPILMILRAYTYTRARYHYFMLDFCYFCNLAVVVNVLWLPNSPWLYWMTYACAMGPVSIAIVAWRNSMVFHSLDKMTSLLIHAFPALMVFVDRWLVDSPMSRDCSPNAVPPALPESLRPWVESWNLDERWIAANVAPSTEPDSGLQCTFPPTWWEFVLLGTVCYAAWQVLYLLCTEVIFGEKLAADPSIVTSLRWLSTARSNSMHQLVRYLLRQVRVIEPDEEFDPSTFKTKFFFVLAQFIYTILCMIPAGLLYQSWNLNIAWMLVTLLAAVWNGATYYIDVFSKRYVQRIQKLIDQQEQAEHGAERSGDQEHHIDEVLSGSSSIHSDEGHHLDEAEVPSLPSERRESEGSGL